MIDEKKLIEELKKRVKTKRSTMEILRDIIPLILKQQKVGEWIPCSERLPDTYTRVLAQIRHHEWITDYDSDWVLEEEKIRHPEYTEVCEARYLGKDIGWEYYNIDDGGSVDYAHTDPVKDMSVPVDEVIAWMPMQKPHKQMEEVVEHENT